MRDLTGHRFGAIELLVLIGRGGMGEVYRGYDHKLGRTVAVKTIRVDSRLSAELKARFVREARLLSRIGHPAICQVHDLVETAEADFLVLEFINGRNLRLVLNEGIDGLQLFDIAGQVARALAAAHEHKVVHRDLKPENVMLTATGQVKVLDFGIARSLGEDEPEAVPDAALATVIDVPTLVSDPAPLTMPGPLACQQPTQRLVTAPEAQAGTRIAGGECASLRSESAYLTQAGAVLGTRRYMSPEQAAGQPVDASTDLYAFGVLLEELQEAVRDGAVRDPELHSLIGALKQIDPAARPTAVAAAERLALLRDKPQRLRRQRLKRRLTWALTSVLALLLAVTVVALLDARRARAMAETRTRQAEDLIGFMMVDLREKLAEVGKLELLDSAGQRALDYFEQVGTTALTARELEVLLRTLNQLTELRINNARYAEAHDLSGRAQAVARQRRDADPAGRAMWSSLLCQAQSLDAYAALEEEDRGRAEQLLGAAGTSCQEALVAAPPTVAVLRIAAATFNAQGAAYVLSRQPQAAIAAMQRSIQLYEQLLALDDAAEARSELAATLGWLSSAHEAAWQLAQAQAARDRNVQMLVQQRQQRPDDRVVEGDLCVALRYRARLELAAGDAAAAERSLREGLALSTALHGIDPDNLLWRRDLALQHAQLGAALARRGAHDAAAQELDTALVALRAFLELDSDNPDRLRLLAQTEQQRAALALEMHEPERALRLLSAARGRWDVLLAANPALVDNPLGLARTLLTLARVHRSGTAPALAEPLLDEALRQLQAISENARDFEVVDTLAAVYEARGEPVRAQPLREQLRAGGFVAVNSAD